MEKSWLQERINFLESYLEENTSYPPKMKERDKNLINVLKEYSRLPEEQQQKLKPLLDKTFERHKTVTRSLKIVDHYSKTHTLSLVLK